MKMNKKIVIALAVLAAFMMLAVPVAIITSSDNVSADDPADITGVEFLAGKEGSVEKTEITSGSYNGYTQLKVLKDLNLTTTVEITSGKYLIVSGEGPYTIYGSVRLFQISNAVIEFDGPNLEVKSDAATDNTAKGIWITVTNATTSPADIPNLTIKSGTFTDKRAATTESKYQPLIHVTGFATFKMTGGTVNGVVGTHEAPADYLHYNCNLTTETGKDYYRNFAAVFLGSQTFSYLEGGSVSSIFSNFNSFGTQNAFMQVTGEFSVDYLWVEYDGGAKKNWATVDGDLTINKELVVVAQLNGSVIDVNKMSELEVSGKLSIVSGAKAIINGKLTLGQQSELILQGCAIVNGTITNNGTIKIVNDETDKAQLVQTGGTITSSSTGIIEVNAVWYKGNAYDKRAIVVKAGTFEKQNVTAKDNDDDSAFMTVTGNGANDVLIKNNTFTMERPNGIGVDNIGTGAVSFVSNTFVSAAVNEVESCIFITGIINSTIAISDTDISGVKAFGTPQKGYSALVFHKPVSSVDNAFSIAGLDSNVNGLTVMTDISSIGIKRGNTTDSTILVVKDSISIGNIAVADVGSSNEKCGVLNIAANKTLNVTGDFYNYGTIDNNGTVIIAAEFSNIGIINNSGVLKFGTYTMADLTKIEGQIAFDGDKTLTASSGSVITWQNGEKLTAGENGTYEMNVDELNTIIKTGTVTLNEGNIDVAGQSITVNEGATFAITNGIALVSGTSIVNKGTTTINGTITCGTTIVLSDLTGVTGMVTLTGDGSIDAAAGSKVTWTTGHIEAETSSAWGAAWDSQKSAYAITITKGIVDMTAPVITGQVLTVNSGATLNVPAGANLNVVGTVVNNGTIVVNKDSSNSATTLTVTGTLINAGVVNVEGTLADSYTATQDAQMIINTNGTINVASTGTLMVGYFTGKGINIDGEINIATGGKFYTYAGAVNKLISSGSDAALIMMTAGTVTIDAKEVGGAVTYTLQKDAKAQFVQANLTGFAFKAGDVIDIDGELTIATTIAIPEGAKLNVNGKVTGGTASVITPDKTATLDIGSSATVSVGKIDMTGSTPGVKAVMIKTGGVITALIDGSTTEAESKANLENIVAGNGGITIIRGSVYINGTIATPDATGKITVPAGAVKISGNVEEGVTLEVPAGSSIVIPKDSTLTFEEGSKFNYDNAATITFEEKSSSIIYEKGSEVNDVVIEVETKEDSEGTTVAVRIYLVSENEKKLIISVDYVEVLPGKTYGDALNGVIVMPTKKSVTFEGWYNLAFNEKIRSTDIVGNNGVTLTACFSDEGRVPVQKEDTPSETIIIDGTTDSQSFAGSDFALPVAIICLIVAILALGFVVLKKR